MNVLENSINVAISHLRTEDIDYTKAQHLTPSEVIVLATMYGNAMYTYEIIDLIPIKSDGRKLVKQGTIYPTVSIMKRKGLIMASRKKDLSCNMLRVYYTVTEAGKASLLAHIIDLLVLLNK